MATDNANPFAKLELRRHFLRAHHASGPINVLDCCQATGLLWRTLRREFQVSSYWGIDVRPEKGRLKLDSSRVLSQAGWTQNVIDIDTYGSPWRHWFALLATCEHSVTVFLTVGFGRAGAMNVLAKEVAQHLGIKFSVRVPPVLIGHIALDAPKWCLGIAEQKGFKIAECAEAEHERISAAEPARYIGIRLEKL